jgi:gamma-glutamylcyclotransferase (GGCT)/AIG2-like uncharacterized protein YtfP
MIKEVTKTNKFFVYGTLKEGRPLDRKLFAELRTSVKPARITGSIFSLGPYPTIKLDGKGMVIGEVHTFKEEDASRIRDIMDGIEGYSPSSPDKGLYNRHKIKATLEENGKEVTAWVYEFNGSVDPKRKLVDGVWEPGM